MTITKMASILFGGIFLMVATFTYSIIVHAEEALANDYDETLFELIEETVGENYNETIVEITAKKELIYDLNLNTLGYTYYLDINDTDGYAMVINEDGIPKVTELFFNATNPYKEITENKIYISPFTYAYYDDGYYDVLTKIKIDDEEINLLSENAYSSSFADSLTQDTVSYETKVVNKYNMVARHPAITLAEYSNACAPVAGANIIQYYDRYCEDLVPDFTPGSSLGNAYLYKQSSDEMTSVAIQLYTDMGTASSSGTTLAQFKNGLNTYCNRYGYSISYNSCMVSGTANLTTMINYMESGQPIALFVGPFAITELSEDDTTDIISYFHYSANHVMVGFGYKTITYTLSSGTRTENMIKVATGIIGSSSGYCCFGDNTSIHDAYAINIG